MKYELNLSKECTPTIYRQRDVSYITRLPKSSLYALMKAGKFLRSFSLSGTRSVGWSANEVDAWCRDRISGVEGGAK